MSTLGTNETVKMRISSSDDMDNTVHPQVDFSAEMSNSIILRSWSAEMPELVIKSQLGISSRDFSVSTEPGRISLVRPLTPATEVVQSPSAAARSATHNSNHDIYLREFRRVASSDFLEYGSYTRCDELLDLWFRNLGQRLGPVINYIFLKSLKDKQSMLLLLKAVSNLPYADVDPYGQVQAMAYLPMEDDELAEAGIRAFENWEHKNGIDILESIQMRESWLEKYRKGTIEYLKGL